MNTNYVTVHFGGHMLKNMLNVIKENYKEYALTTIIFIIGLFIGIMLVNNCNEEQMQEFGSYIGDFITKFKSESEINTGELIGMSMRNNFLLAFAIWIAGTTVIGLPIVLIVILYRGLSLGLTVAIFSYSLGKFNGILFCIISMLLQNIIFIPALLTLGVSSIKLYKSIIRNRDRENIKTKIIRHSVISGLMVVALMISSIVENMVSLSFLKNFIKYF